MLSAAGSLQWYGTPLAPQMSFDDLLIEAEIRPPPRRKRRATNSSPTYQGSAPHTPTRWHVARSSG